MNMMITAERIEDFAPIAVMTEKAFAHRHGKSGIPAETLLIDLLRHRSEYQNELALVARDETGVIGSGIFSPYRLYCRGTAVEAVMLAPLCARPDRQKKGVGAALLDEGHTRAARMGFAAAFLWGHPTYYPRFGYRTAAFASGHITVDLSSVAPVEPDQLRPAVMEDYPAVDALWQALWAHEPLALSMGGDGLSVVAWSPDRPVRVLVRGGKVTGYLRYEASQPGAIHELLAADDESMRILLGVVKALGASQAVIAARPGNLRLTALLTGLPIVKTELTAADAFMIKPLNLCPVLEEYLDRTAQNTDDAGVLNLPPVFDPVP